MNKKENINFFFCTLQVGVLRNTFYTRPTTNTEQRLFLLLILFVNMSVYNNN